VVVKLVKKFLKEEAVEKIGFFYSRFNSHSRNTLWVCSVNTMTSFCFFELKSPAKKAGPHYTGQK